MARRVRIKNESTRRKGRMIKFIFYLLLLAFLGVTAYLVFFSGFLAVSNITVQGTQRINAENIISDINSGLGGKYGNILPKNNIIYLSVSRLKTALAEKYKKIADVSIRKKFPSTLDVVIQEKKITAVYSLQGKYYLIDENGVAFEEIMPDSPDCNNIEWPIIIDSSNGSMNLGETMISPTFIAFLEKIKGGMNRELDIDLGREFTTPNHVSGDMRTSTNEGWSVFFDASLDPAKEIGMLKTVLDEKIPRDQRGNLEYIDLRIDNKVFYKFKDGNAEEVKPEEQKAADQQPKTEEKKEKKKNH